jgi:hypothetical protein
VHGLNFHPGFVGGAVNVVATGNIWKASGYTTGPVVGALHAASAGNAAV